MLPNLPLVSAKSMGQSSFGVSTTYSPASGVAAEGESVQGGTGVTVRVKRQPVGRLNPVGEHLEAGLRAQVVELAGEPVGGPAGAFPAVEVCASADGDYSLPPLAPRVSKLLTLEPGLIADVKRAAEPPTARIPTDADEAMTLDPEWVEDDGKERRAGDAGGVFRVTHISGALAPQTLSAEAEVSHVSTSVARRRGVGGSAAEMVASRRIANAAHFAENAAPPGGVVTGEDAVNWFITGPGAPVTILGEDVAGPEASAIASRIVYCLERSRYEKLRQHRRAGGEERGPLGSGSRMRVLRGYNEGVSTSDHRWLEFDPYDLVAVPQSAIDFSADDPDNEYHTVSVNGVMFYKPGEKTQVTALLEWTRHRRAFKVLCKIPFFRDYCARKALETWAENVRYVKFQGTRRKLAQRLIHLQPEFAPALRRIAGLMRVMQVGHQGWIKKKLETHELPLTDALGKVLVKPEDDPEDAGYVPMDPKRASAKRWIKLKPPPTTSRRKRRLREEWEEDDEEDVEAATAVSDAWRASEAAADAMKAGIDLGLLVAEAGRNGVGARLATVRSPRTATAMSLSEFSTVREAAMERGGSTIYAAVGYATSEAIRAAKQVIAAAHATVPVDPTQQQARAKRFEKPDRDAWKAESLSTMKEKEESDKTAARAAAQRLHMLGRFVRMCDMHVADTLVSIAAVACRLYGDALRAAGTDDRSGLFLITGSLPLASSREVTSASAGQASTVDGPIFSPAPLELCRLAEVVPDQICSMLATVPRPSFVPDLAAWAPEAGPIMGEGGGLNVMAPVMTKTSDVAHTGRYTAVGTGAMGAAGASKVIGVVELIIRTITGRRSERIGLLRRRETLGSDAEDDEGNTVLLARMRDVARVNELAAELRELVSGGYLAAMDSSAVMAYRESGALHAFALAWSPEEYRRQEPSAEDYCTDVQAVKMWHADITEATVNAVCGPITVDTAELKQAILPLSIVTLEGMLELLRQEYMRHCRDTVGQLTVDMAALMVRPTQLDEFAVFLELAVPHFEGGETRQAAATALEMAIVFHELLASNPLTTLSTSSESVVSSRAGLPRMDSLSSGEGDASSRAGKSGSRVSSSSLSKRNDRESKEIGNVEEKSLAPQPTLADLKATHARYKEEAEAAHKHVLSFAPLMASALEAAAIGARADLAAVLASARSHPITDPDTSPANALKALATARELATKAANSAEATARQRLLLGVQETEPLANLSTSVEAAFSLLDARGALWEALERWYDFLGFLENADVFNSEITGRADDFEREIAGAEAAVASLEGCHDTLEVEDVEGLLPLEAALGVTLRLRLKTWRSDQTVINRLMHPAIKFRHWKALIRGLKFKRKREQQENQGASISAEVGDGHQPGRFSSTAQHESGVSGMFSVLTGGQPMPLVELLRNGLLEASHLVERVWRRAVAEAELGVRLEALYERWLATLLLPQVLTEDEVKARAALEEQYWIEGMDGEKLHPIGNLPECSAAVEEAQASLVSVAASPHRPACQTRFDQIEAELLAAEEALAATDRAQHTWKFLRGLFKQPGMRSLFPAEALRFDEWQTALHLATSAAVKGTWVKGTTTGEQGGEVPKAVQWGGALHDAATIDAGLADVRRACGEGLTPMREQCARMSFLGDDELLRAVAAGSDPAQVPLDVLTCMFPGIASLSLEMRGIAKSDVGADGRLRTTPGAIAIVAVHSHRGETLHLVAPVMAGGDVPPTVWINNLDAGIGASMRDETRSCLRGVASRPGHDWVVGGLTQAVTLVDAIVWTDAVHGALYNTSRGKMDALRNLQAAAAQRLQALAEPAAKAAAEDMPCKRTYSSLVTSSVYHRDVATNLIKADANSPESFEWQKQVRHQWEEGGDETGRARCLVHCGTAVLMYGFEYLGDRGVGAAFAATAKPTSPATSAVIGALAHTGIAAMDSIVGAQGTASELSHNISVAVGRANVKFCCAVSPDARRLASIMTGCARIGAWVTLEGAAALAPAALSRLAQDLATVRSFAAGQAETINLGGQTLYPPTNSSGSAGGGFSVLMVGVCDGQDGGNMRQAASMAPAPAPLKAACTWLTRTAQPVQRDPSPMFEASLRCVGVPSGSRRAARRITVALRTLKDLLPPRDGYDIGPSLARAILIRLNHPEKKLDVEGIVAAGMVQCGENDLVKAADFVAAHIIRVTVRPRLWGVDLPLFDTIVRDIFTPPGEKTVAKEPPMPHDYQADNSVRRTITVKILDAISVSRSCTVLGCPGSGKTTAIRQAAGAVNAHVRTVFPGSLNRGFLLGGYHAVGLEWANGALPTMLAQPEPTGYKCSWVHLDGPIAGHMAECAGVATLVENGELMLQNGEHARVKKGGAIVMEISSAAALTPRLLFSGGVVYVSPAGPKVLEAEVAATMEKWSTAVLHGGFGFEGSTPKEMMRQLPAALLTTRPRGTDVAGLPGVVLTHLTAALRLAEHTLRPPSPTEESDEGEEYDQHEAHVTPHAAAAALLHGALWAVGYTMEHEARDEWEATVSEMLLPLVPPPPGAPEDAPAVPAVNSLFDLKLVRVNGALVLEAGSSFDDPSVDPLPPLPPGIAGAPSLGALMMLPAAARPALHASRLLEAGVAIILAGSPGAGKTACLAATSARAAAHGKCLVAHTALRAGAGAGCLERVLKDRMQRHRIGRWRARNAESLLLCVDDVHVPTLSAAASATNPPAPGAFEFLRQLVSTGTFWDTGSGSIGGDAQAERTRVLVAGQIRKMVATGNKSSAGASAQQLIRLLLPVRVDSERQQMPPAHVLATACLPNTNDAGIAVETRDAIAAASAHLVSLLSSGARTPASAVPKMDIVSAAAIVRGTFEVAAAAGISHAAAWRNEARRVICDRLAEPSDQLAFNRALAAAAVVHLTAGAAGPLADATGTIDPNLDDAPVQPTAHEAELAIAGCTATNLQRKQLEKSGAITAKPGTGIPSSVFGPNSRTEWPDAATYVARAARALRCAWGEGGHLALLGDQAGAAGVEDLAHATAAAEGAECIVVNALASPTLVDEIDTRDARAEAVRSLVQAIKLAGAGERRVVLLVTERAAASDASLTPLHEVVAAGGRAPGHVTDLQLSVWLHDKKNTVKSGLAGADLASVMADAKSAKEMAIKAKADAAAAHTAAVLKAAKGDGVAGDEAPAADTPAKPASTQAELHKDGSIPGGMKAAERRAEEFAAGVRDNLRIICCTNAARWAIITERFPALARACTVNTVIPIDDDRLTEHLVTCATDLGLDHPSEELVTAHREFTLPTGGGSQDGDAILTGAAAATATSALGDEGDSRASIVLLSAALCEMHRAAVTIATEYERSSGRTAAVRRERAVEALRLFARLHSDQRSALKIRRETLRTAMNKLEEADTGREAVEARLAAIAPHLNKGVADNQGNLIRLADAVREVDRREAEILAEEERIARVCDQVARVRAEGVSEMEAASNAYNGAMDSLANIEMTDLDELRSYPTPPGLVRIVMEAVCLLMNGEAGDWESARAFLADSAVKSTKKHGKKHTKKTKKKDAHDSPGEDDHMAAPLLLRLRKFKKESVPDERVRKLQKYVRAQNFNPKAVQQVSMAARSLCEWVLAVDSYAKIRAAVAFKESKLREADGKVANTREALAVKGKALAEARRSLALLQEDHGDARAQKEELEAARAEAQTHLEHIKSLVDSFAKQRQRWTEALRECETAMKSVTGDSLAAAVAIAYLGPFDEVFRRRLNTEWASILVRFGIPSDPSFTLIGYLRKRHPSAALPLPMGERLDVPLTDSVLLTLNAAKPPLLLDPEGEAPGLLRRAITASQETAAGKAGADAGNSGRWTLLRAADAGAVERASHALQSGANVMLSLDGAVSPPSPALIALVSRSAGPPLPAVGVEPPVMGATGVPSVTTGMSSVAIMPRGMLVLHLRGPNPAAPDALASLCSPVLYLAGTAGLEERFLSCIARHVAPRTEEHLRVLHTQIATDEQTFTEVEAKVTAFVARGNDGGAVWDDSALVDSLVASTMSLEGLRKRVATARAERSAAEARLTRYHGIAQLATVLHVLCRDMSVRDPRYSLPFVQHAAIFRRALSLTRVASKGVNRPRSASRKRIDSAIVSEDANISAADKDDELGGPEFDPPAEEMRELELATLRTQVSLVDQRLSLALREALHVLLAARVLLTAGVLAPEEWEFLAATGAMSPAGAGGGSRADGMDVVPAVSASAPWPGPALARAVARLEASYPTGVFEGMAASLADPTEAPTWRAWLSNPSISVAEEKVSEAAAAAAAAAASAAAMAKSKSQSQRRLTSPSAATAPAPTPAVTSNTKRSPQPPGEWKDRLGSFHRLVLLQALAPTSFSTAAAAFAAPFVGAERGDAQHQILASAAADAGSARPVLLHSSPAGEDAASALTHASIVLGHRHPPTFVFLGQGGAAAAEHAIVTGRKEGTWVVLMHIEMEPSFLPRLSAMLLNYEATIQKDARHGAPHPGHTLWICCASSAISSLPPSLVAVSSLAALEPPSTVRAGLLRCLAAAAAAEQRCAGFFGPLPASITSNKAAAEGATRDLAGWQRHVMGFAIGHAVANLRLKPSQPRFSDMDFLEAIEICRKAVHAQAKEQTPEEDSMDGAGGEDSEAGGRGALDYRLLTEDLVEGCWMARQPMMRSEAPSVLTKFICHDVLLSSYAIPPPEDLINAPGALPGGIPRGATLQQLLRYGEALQPLDDPAAKNDAVNAIALPEIELRRRARGASEALLSRLADLSAAPALAGLVAGAGGAAGLLPASSASGGGTAVAASSSLVATGGGDGGVAAVLAETCAALQTWLIPLVHRFRSLSDSLSAAVGKPVVDQPTPASTPGLGLRPNTPMSSGRVTPGGTGAAAAAAAAHHQRLMLTALLRPVWASEAASGARATETALSEVREIIHFGVSAAAAAAAAAVEKGTGVSSQATLSVAAAGAGAAHLGAVTSALLAGKTPQGWSRTAALEGCPLAVWQRGLDASANLLSSISDPSDPASVPWSFRLSDFANPSEVLQAHILAVARCTGVSPETIRLVGKVEEVAETGADLGSPPKRCGVAAVGLTLHGARWDRTNLIMTDDLEATGGGAIGAAVGDAVTSMPPSAPTPNLSATGSFKPQSGEAVVGGTGSSHGDTHVMPIMIITPTRVEDLQNKAQNATMYHCPLRRAPPPWDHPQGDDRPGGEVILHIPLDARKNKDYWARKRISLYCE